MDTTSIKMINQDYFYSFSWGYYYNAGKFVVQKNRCVINLKME
ncbi:hypothetical protein [Alkalibaculum sporogenes]|nr:hypothetical protein [Alkalibaculum sporogenes]